MPDSNWLYQQSLQAMQSAFNPANINNYYNQASGNLSRVQGSAVNRAQSDAGALAASRGYANPSAMVRGAGTGVYQQFAPQFGNLEQGRASALQMNAKDLYNAYFNQYQAHRQSELQQQQLDYQGANPFSYLGAGLGALSLPLMGGSNPISLGGYLLGAL